VDEQGLITDRAGKEFFLFAIVSRPALGPTKSPIQWIVGVEKLGHETNCSLTSNAEVKNALPICLCDVVVNYAMNVSS